jgi:hypothetical protein
MVNMDAPQLRFFGGLLWYLEMRNWALERIRACPHGSNIFEIRMSHDLYFSYLFGAIDHVADHLRDDPTAQRAFMDQVAAGFGDANSNGYARELRNEIVHRGLDSSAAAHSDNATLYVLCPPTVTDRKRKKTYTRPFTYTIQLASHCNAAANLAIGELLESLDLFNPAHHIVREVEAVAAISGSAVMPDWAKAMIPSAFAGMDYSAVAQEVAAARIKKMRALLDRNENIVASQ